MCLLLAWSARLQASGPSECLDWSPHTGPRLVPAHRTQTGPRTQDPDWSPHTGPRLVPAHRTQTGPCTKPLLPHVLSPGAAMPARLASNEVVQPLPERERVSIKVIIKTKKQRTVIKMFSTKCKSLNFRNSKSYFSPQNAHSSIKKAMNILNNRQMTPQSLIFFASRLCQ